MAILTKVSRIIDKLAHSIEDPRLFRLYSRGGVLSTFITLNQPWFRELEIATVLDIGANTGQFAITMNFVLPKAKIYSFEPLPDCFEALQTRMKGVENFTAFNLGLGNESGILEFERNSFSPSSSFLKVTDIHKTAFPFTGDSNPVSVKVERLDTVVEQLTVTEPLMIKIDVQGYEDRVLSGGEQTIKRAKIIFIETSFEMLYEEQPLFGKIYEQLTNWGFNYMGALDQLHNPRRGQILQADSIFIKRS